MISRKLAIIDLGTNTFHLLIADVKSESISILYKEKVAVRLGAGGINAGTITPEAEKRALDTLRYFKRVIGKFKIEEVHASGTSALRNAANAQVIIERIYSELGFQIEIISGKREAELIYQGVKKAMLIGEKPALIMDIGGGSVEFIIANNDEIKWLQSFEIGGQRLLEKFHHEDPISDKSIKNILAYLEEQLQPLLTAIKTYSPKSLIGCSGTFDTLTDIIYSAKDWAKEEKSSYEISISDYEEIHADIISKNLKERIAIPGMIEMRAEMIVVACCLIKFIIEEAKIEQVRVSTYALKEGYLDYIINR